MSLSVVPVANLTAGQFIAAIVDSTTTSKLFTSVGYSGPAAGDATAPTIESGIVGFPTVAAVPTVVPATDGTNSVGLVSLSLTPNAGDVVNASSPMTVKVGPGALAIVASGATG